MEWVKGISNLIWKLDASISRSYNIVDLIKWVTLLLKFNIKKNQEQKTFVINKKICLNWAKNTTLNQKT